MNKYKKKSSQKQFMQTMIITGIVGLSIMMIVMLYMIKLFGPKKTTIVPEALAPITGDNQEEHVESESISGIIHDIDSKRKNIKVWDIQENQHIKVNIKDKTQMIDQYGKPMSIQEVQLGDIVEITYETKKKDILMIQKSAKAWRKSEISGVDINIQNKRIQIGNVKYDYTSDIIVINDKLEIVDISNINSLDSLMIQGIDDTIWSIQVAESAGYLKLMNMPTTKGTIEIGNNIIYRLEELEGDIPLPGGQHKIVIRMEGYQPFVKSIRISTNEVQELDLKEVEEAVSNLKVKVANITVDYEIQIDNKIYKKDEAIRVKPGQYTLKVTAEGFKIFEMEIQLEEGNRIITVTLQPEKEEPAPETEEQKPAQEKPIQEKPSQEPPKADSDPNPVEEIKTVQIIIETDPANAQVFVSGVYKGTTPALTGLKPGEYSITIEKEGYSTLYSTLIIDASNAQKGFLYTLQKE